VKTSVATAISLVAVLGAGSAAALVNTDILDSGSSAPAASAALAPPTTSGSDTALVDEVNAALEGFASTGATSTQGEPSSDSVPAAGSSVAPASSAPLVQAAPTTFDVGDAGSVVVDLENGRLTIVSASADTGWTVTKTEEASSGDEVEVWYETATARVMFTAELEDGRIVPRVDAKALGSNGDHPATQPVPSATPTVTRHDDDGEYDDGEHDDGQHRNGEYDDGEHDDD
jgi:hypothetical protein